MSTKRPVTSELLHAWVDGEAGERAADVTEQVANDPALAAEADSVRRLGGTLRATVDDALGPVDPLFALTRIRQRVAEKKARSPFARLGAWWSDVTTYNRRAFAGVALAMALGAISAPGVVWLTGHAVSSPSPEVLQVPSTDQASYVTDAPAVLTVRLVSAHDRDNVLDARLAGVAAAVKRPGATGYALAGETVVRAEPGSAARVELPEGDAVVLRPRGTFSGALRVDVDLDASDVHTTVNLAPGGTGTVDGPGSLVIAISRD
jgi:hypothetical protein